MLIRTNSDIPGKISEANEIAFIFEGRLKQFPLARETDRVQVVIRGDKRHIGYYTSTNTEQREGTHFDITVQGEIGDVLNFDIIGQEKRKGYGTQLYTIIEDCCKALGCKSMQTSASGQGQYFWPKMGFSKLCQIKNTIGLEKSIV